MSSLSVVDAAAPLLKRPPPVRPPPVYFAATYINMPPLPGLRRWIWLGQSAAGTGTSGSAPRAPSPTPHPRGSASCVPWAAGPRGWGARSPCLRGLPETRTGSGSRTARPAAPRRRCGDKVKRILRLVWHVLTYVDVLVLLFAITTASRLC